MEPIVLIRELLRSWWRLELALADANGYVVNHSDGEIAPSDNEFCRRVLFSQEGFRRCNESVKATRDSLLGPKRRGRRRTASTEPAPSLVVHECHLGFAIVAAPIRVDGTLIGFLFTGGAHSGEPGAAAGKQLASNVRELTTMSAREIQERAAEVPRLSEDELERVGQLLRHGAGHIARACTSAARAESERSSADDTGARFPEIIGEAPSMRAVYQLLDKVSRTDATVLIHGESGTGKELIARAIHFHGPRAKGPFVVQNCSAFNDNLLESALFGHVKGAFTGAVADRSGLFAEADGGTFFLDEIGDMSPALQVKLLRVLQEGRFTPVGATREVSVDVRIVAASHKDLAELVARGAFREDLFYRINVIGISLPPLRERLQDLELLIAHFLGKHTRGKPSAPRLSSEAVEVLRGYRWPGNIRELENEIERLLVLADELPEIPASMISPRMIAARTSRATRQVVPKVARIGNLREIVERVEAEVIGQGLIRTHWNKSQLAKELGISRSNLIQKCNQYGLGRKE